MGDVTLEPIARELHLAAASGGVPSEHAPHPRRALRRRRGGRPWPPPPTSPAATPAAPPTTASAPAPRSSTTPAPTTATSTRSTGAASTAPSRPPAERAAADIRRKLARPALGLHAAGAVVTRTPRWAWCTRSRAPPSTCPRPSPCRRRRRPPYRAARGGLLKGNPRNGGATQTPSGAAALVRFRRRGRARRGARVGDGRRGPRVFAVQPTVTLDRPPRRDARSLTAMRVDTTAVTLARGRARGRPRGRRRRVAVRSGRWNVAKATPPSARRAPSSAWWCSPAATATAEGGAVTSFGPVVAEVPAAAGDARPSPATRSTRCASTSRRPRAGHAWQMPAVDPSRRRSARRPRRAAGVHRGPHASGGQRRSRPASAPGGAR